MNDKDLVICQEKVSDKHTSSFWYDGLVASINGYELWALGEIKGVYKGETLYGNSLVEKLYEKGDKELQKVDFYDNNWFEIIDPNGSSDFPMVHDYDDAIFEMIAMSKEGSENGNN
jgi:hypothetical protein